MKVDRHDDPYEDLKREVIDDIEYAATRLGGKVTHSTQNYRGRISKVITIEYDVENECT